MDDFKPQINPVAVIGQAEVDMLPCAGRLAIQRCMLVAQEAEADYASE
jgi:hypothetical protein